MWYFFDFSSSSRFPLKLFLKQDKYFLKPTADSNLILWLLETSWGMVNDKVIVVSADGILRVLNVFSRFSAAITKDDDYGRECHRCRWCTTLVTRKLLRFLRIDQEWSPFAFLFLRKACIRAGSKMGCVELCNFHFCCASIFDQPMKKFEFFGETRATR